jgi:nitronate monooxygenase
MARLHTALCDLLGIEYPIVQSGMGGTAGPELVAEVCKAGGLGIIAGLNLTPDDLRARIRRVRELTGRPFGVNLWLHTEIMPPVDPATVPEASVLAVQQVLNAARETLGLAPATGRPDRAPDLIPGAIEVILEERVPVFSIGLGDPGTALVSRCHARDVKVMAMVATVEDARQVAHAGVDAVVAQGGEAGGHRSTWVKRASREEASIGGLALIPQVVDAVGVPVIAAGGIADGRGLVAAMALGAAGVLLGTRFVATRESAAPEFWKKAVLERGSDSTTITDAWTGLWARTFRSAHTQAYAASGAPVLPPLVQARAAQDVYGAAAAQEKSDYFPMHVGQSVGLVHDLPGAGEVVAAIVRAARIALDAL